MHPPSVYTRGNSLLDCLIALSGQDVLQQAEVLHFASGDVSLHTNDLLDFVHFPISMMIATTTLMMDGYEIEVSTIGREECPAYNLLSVLRAFLAKPFAKSQGLP